ncbi:hypothetical protein [Paenibacillus medicaginis]|uniref:Uncharacterized protein n=1 Tax=Paenibacillus medicaginis TaxID=1470560 RepID=A0ABV5BUW9_9BACL
MVEKYDGETRKFHRFEMYRAEDVAQNGLNADIKTAEAAELPSPEILGEMAKKHGYDTFEVTVVTEKLSRYVVTD